jgi:hypothetical protein
VSQLPLSRQIHDLEDELEQSCLAYNDHNQST